MHAPGAPKLCRQYTRGRGLFPISSHFYLSRRDMIFCLLVFIRKDSLSPSLSLTLSHKYKSGRATRVSNGQRI